MKQIKNKKSENGFTILVKSFCRKTSKVFNYFLKSCEDLSGQREQIEAIQTRIKNEIVEAKNIKKELEKREETSLEKDEKIKNLCIVIEQIGFNFREKNYNEVDRILKHFGL